MPGKGYRQARGGQPRESARCTALRLLAYQSRSEKELGGALARRGYSPDECNQAVEEMKRRGYVDDESAAARWAQHAAEDRRYGVSGVARRLQGRGIDPELAGQAARDAYSAVGLREEEVALRLAEARMGARELTDANERDREMRRIAGFLQRRGFGAETVARVLRQLFCAHRDPLGQLDSD